MLHYKLSLYTNKVFVFVIQNPILRKKIRIPALDCRTMRGCKLGVLMPPPARGARPALLPPALRGMLGCLTVASVGGGAYVSCALYIQAKNMRIQKRAGEEVQTLLPTYFPIKTQMDPIEQMLSHYRSCYRLYRFCNARNTSFRFQCRHRFLVTTCS